MRDGILAAIDYLSSACSEPAAARVLDSVLLAGLIIER